MTFQPQMTDKTEGNEMKNYNERKAHLTSSTVTSSMKTSGERRDNKVASSQALVRLSLSAKNNLQLIDKKVSRTKRKEKYLRRVENKISFKR